MATKKPAPEKKVPAKKVPAAPDTPAEAPEEAAPDQATPEEAAEQKTAEKPAKEKKAKAAKPAKKPKPVAAPKPKRSQGVWGIDLGQCSLKAVRLEEIDGVLQATAFDFIEHPKILSQPDADRDALIREALEKFLANNNHLKGDKVAISVPGQSALTRFVKLPPVQQDKIADIVKFEAKQQIPFNLDEVIWDYQKVGEGTVTEGFAMDTEIGLFAMKHDAIQLALQNFKDVGVEIDYVQIAPLALCNYLTYDALGITPGTESTPSQGCVVALDMGADSTNLVITNGGRIIWQKVISTGGNHFTRALTKDLKLTFAKAEHTKRNAAKSKDLKLILAALKPVLNDFEGELKRSLNYFQNAHRSAQLEYILGMGNAFRLPGLQKFLEEKLGMPVKRLQKYDRLTGDAVLNAPVFQENIGTFATAYGLALQGLEKARLYTNLLPPELRSERMIRAKKPWFLAASALLLVGLGATALRYGMDLAVYGDPGVAKAVTAANGVATQAQTAESAISSTRQKAQDEESGVKSVVAGQKEHVNWLELLKFVSDAVPRPDASNLPEDVEQTYFINPPADLSDRRGAMSGKKAFEFWQQRQAKLQLAPVPEEQPGMQPMVGFPMPMPPGTGTNPAAEEELGQGIDDLIQFNIESVDCRYCSDLEKFFVAVKKWKDQQEGNYLPRSAFRTPPKNPYGALPGEAEKKGWVVELRGYTFHSGQRTFIVKSLLENLNRMGRPDLNKLPAAGAGMEPMPAVQPMPGGQPMEGAPTAAENLAELAKKPVVNRVSHIILLEVESTPTGDTGNLKFVSVLDQLVREAAAPGGGMLGGPGSMPGSTDIPAMPMGSDSSGGGAGTGPSRDTWQPLGGSTTAGTGPGGVVQPGMGRPPFGGKPSIFNPPGGTTTPTAGTSRHSRTEFIILFVWFEPIPSDALRGQEGGPTP